MPSRVQVGFGLGLLGCPPFWVVLVVLFVYGIGKAITCLSPKAVRDTVSLRKSMDWGRGHSSGGGASISLANVWSRWFYYLVA